MKVKLKEIREAPVEGQSDWLVEDAFGQRLLLNNVVMVALDDTNTKPSTAVIEFKITYDYHYDETELGAETPDSN
jgi:hypothetical protein